ncbi:hypothetical protein KSS87_020722 [Heliosperma pusillum]|nr:hypothetical protein KSS87_015872 [Heliosperma pusillum]KAH9618936.1 hypothetical protein KSS87_020722 [Heliosperma pusillum]
MKQTSYTPTKLVLQRRLTVVGSRTGVGGAALMVVRTLTRKLVRLVE